MAVSVFDLLSIGIGPSSPPTVFRTGDDMSAKYKETPRGGLTVNIVEC